LSIEEKTELAKSVYKKYRADSKQISRLTGQTGSADTSNSQYDALNRLADAFLHVGHYFLVGVVVRSFQGAYGCA